MLIRMISNGAIIVDTELDPLSLLGVTQGIEGKMGREKLFLNGPRNIDLDILLYEEETVEKGKSCHSSSSASSKAFCINAPE